MPEDATAPSNEPARVASRFTSLHARTYEMELLVSGGVVFGLLQLPPVVASAFRRLIEGLAGDLRLVVSMLQGYVYLGLLVLVGAFVMHLVLRAYWIGLLGLESVFPEGIRWNKVQLGPFSLRLMREKVGSLARSVDAADDLCSLVFSFAFLIVIIFVYSILMLLLAIAAGLAISRLAFAGEHLAVVVWVVFFALLGYPTAVTAADKRLGPHMVAGRAPARIFERLVASASLFTPARWVGPIQFTLGSNTSPARLATLITLVCLVLGGSFVAVTLVQSGLVRLDDQRFFPASLRSQGVDPRHYRDRCLADGLEVTSPSIQSFLVDEPYVALVVRYVPRRHNDLVASVCPAVLPLRRTGLVVGRGGEATKERVTEVAACLGALFDVSLDGVSLDDLSWDFTREEGSDLPAVMALVPVADLAAGRHELDVLVPGRRATPAERNEERHVIPFWR